VVRPQYDLTSYLAVTAHYRSSNHAAALREIVEWRSAEIEAAVRALRKAEDRLRAIPVQATDIDFRTVEAALRDALALDPGLQEPRLRLGKLLLDERRTIEAEPLLAEVDERGADDRQRYLARLFLGRVAERRERPEEATRLYRRALEAWPDSQAARLALAHALERLSGPAVPPVLVRATLAASRRLVRAPDPWWHYPFGPPGLAKAALDRVWDRALGQ